MLLSEERASIRFLSAHRILRSAGYAHTSGIKSYYALSMRLWGDADFCCGEQELHITTDNILIIPPGCSYSQETEGEEILAVHFEANVTDESNLILTKPEDPETYRKKLQEIYDLYTGRESMSWYYTASSILNEIIGGLVSTSKQRYSSQNDSIDEAAQYMEEHILDSDVTVSSLAKRSGYSEAYFRRQFEERYLKTPQERIAELRLRHAKQLLEKSGETIAEISDHCGFSNSKYFSTWFRQKTGMCPRDYAASIRG